MDEEFDGSAALAYYRDRKMCQLDFLEKASDNIAEYSVSVLTWLKEWMFAPHPYASHAVWANGQWKYCPQESIGRMLDSLQPWLPRIDIVLWKRQLWDMCTEGAHSFDGTPVTADLCISHPQLWIYDARKLYSQTRNAVDCDFWEFVGDAWYFGELVIPESRDNVRGIRFIPLFSYVYKAGCLPEDPNTAYELATGKRITANEGYELNKYLNAPLWRPLPAIFEGDTIDPATALWIAGLKFLNTKVAAREPVLLPRSTRRRAEREGRTLPKIEQVVLRRRESGTGGGEGRDWSCQWVVRGHWRQQWHGPNKPKEPAFVEAYVKGPADKPLRLPTEKRERVYVAKR
jgi:hypothetical protein